MKDKGIEIHKWKTLDDTTAFGFGVAEKGRGRQTRTSNARPRIPEDDTFAGSDQCLVYFIFI